MSWYLDLDQIARYTDPADSGAGQTAPKRVYHHTAPVSMVMALHAGLGVLLDEGLDAAWARHAMCGRSSGDGSRQARARARSRNPSTGYRS